MGANSIGLGLNAGATGTLTVESGATLTSTAGLAVGVGVGTGIVVVQTGGTLNTGAATSTTVSGAVGTLVLLDGTGSSWNAGSVNIGDIGTGALAVRNSATLNVTADLTIAATSAYSGPLTDTFAIASGGTAIVGGSVTIGNNPNIVAVATIDGAGSFLQDMGGLLIGNNGAGQLTITNRGGVSAVGINIGGFSSAPSLLTVNGAGSAATASGNLLVGYNGNGTLAIQAGGAVLANEIILGDQSSANGTITVDGTNSSLTSSTDLVVGFFGAGHLTVSNGGHVTSNNSYIGYEPGFADDVTVTGNGSTWTTTGGLFVGGDTTTTGTGALTISTGGSVNADGVLIAFLSGSVGTVTVQGPNSTLADSNALTVGFGGVGTLLVSNGGTVTSTAGAIGFTTGTATVDGAGSKWTNTGDLIIGSNGSGTLTLSNGGVTSVSGSVFMAQATGSAGTLNIGAAPGSTATGAGTLTASSIQIGSGAATINFNHTDAAYIFSPAILGPGTINQISGVTDMTADSSLFTGTTNITGGRLAVNGSLANSDATVASGGILGGNGTIGGIVALSGGIVGPGNSIGTLHVAGNVMFLAGSIYQVEANAAGQGDKLVVAGSTSMSGGTVQVLAAAGNYAPSTQYTILTASTGIGGTFAGVTSNLAFLTPTLSYDPENVYLTLTRNSVAFQNVGLTNNQIEAGTGVQSLGAGNAIYQAILPLDAATARNAFDQLSGEIHPSVKTGIIEDSRFVREAAINRLRAAFDAVGAVSPPVASSTTGRPVPAADSLTFWSQGFGSWGTTDSDGNAARLDRRTSGFLMGVDTLTSSDIRVGLLGGYSHSAVDADARSSGASIDNFHLGAYGGLQWGALGLRSGAAYTWHRIDTTRSVAFAGFSDRLSSAYDAGTAQVFGDVGYRISAGSAAFEPFANLAYVNLATNGFSESGTTAGLTGRSDTTSVAYTTTGLRSAATFSLGTMSATMRGTLGWRHADGDTTPTTALHFAGGTDFSIEGAPIARNAALIDAGLDVAIQRDIHLSLSYAGQIAAHAEDHSVKANLDWRF